MYLSRVFWGTENIWESLLPTHSENTSSSEAPFVREVETSAEEDLIWEDKVFAQILTRIHSNKWLYISNGNKYEAAWLKH